jgi:hypothetical protein
VHAAEGEDRCVHAAEGEDRCVHAAEGETAACTPPQARAQRVRLIT